jgi:outer membrane protein
VSSALNPQLYLILYRSAIQTADKLIPLPYHDSRFTSHASRLTLPTVNPFLKISFKILQNLLLCYLAAVNKSLMNKLSVALNVVLIAAIGYLYYYDFSGKKEQGSSSRMGVAQNIKDSCTTQHRIAYVDLDSLNENLVYLKQKRKELDSDQKKVEAQIAADYKDLESKKNNFLQKNPNAKPEELQQMQALLLQEQDRIEGDRQKQSQVFNQRRFSLLEGIQKDLKGFLADYNKEKKFQYILTTGLGIDYLIYKDSTLDITRDVIKGMNEKWKPTTQ